MVLVLAVHHRLHLITYALRCIAEVLEDGLEELQARTAWHQKDKKNKCEEKDCHAKQNDGQIDANTNTND